MFTGIIEEVGRVVAFRQEKEAWKLQIAARAALQNTVAGDSISINGCCLTVTHFDSEHLYFDVLEETRRVTTFSALKAGTAVNLERSLVFNGKIGGHFLTGHVDAQGTIEAFELRGVDYYLRIRVPGPFSRYLVGKGSIAVEGISLTVAEVEDNSFAVWLIPHTLSQTNLREHQIGNDVNLEFDLLAKYIEKLTAYGRSHA